MRARLRLLDLRKNRGKIFDAFTAAYIERRGISTIQVKTCLASDDQVNWHVAWRTATKEGDALRDLLQ